MGQYVVLLLSPSGLNLEHADVLGSPMQCLLVNIYRHVLNLWSKQKCPASPVQSYLCLVTSVCRLVNCSVHQHPVHFK